MAAGTPNNRLPAFPVDLAHIWADFGQLKSTKLAGFSSQQITWTEINAYDAATQAGLSIWEKRLIRRLDDISEAARLGISTKTKATSVAEMRASLRTAIAVRQARAANKEGATE